MRRNGTEQKRKESLLSFFVILCAIAAVGPAPEAEPADLSAYPADILVWDEAEKEKQRQAGAELVKAVKAAVEKGQKEFVAAPSHYRFKGWQKRPTMPGHHAFVILHDIHDFTMDLKGSTFWFEDHICGISISNCKNLTLKNLYVDWDPLPFTQGTIVGADPERRSVTVELDKGYERVTPRFQRLVDPKQNDPALQGSLYAGSDTTQLKKGLGDFRWLPFWNNAVGPRTYRVQIANPVDFGLFNMEIGDKVTISMRTGEGFSIRDSEALTLENVTLFSNPGISFFNSKGRGRHVYRRCKVTRRPGTNRLLSGNADAFHFTIQEKGPVLEESQVDSINDDCVNIHGAFASVLWQEDPTTLIVSRYPFPSELTRNDLTMRFFSDADMAYLGTRATTQVAEIQWKVEEGRYLQPIERRPHFKGEPPYGKELTVVRVTLKEPIEVTKPAIASIDDYVCSGAIIRNCRFKNSVVRGLLLHTLDARVEGNRFEHLGKSAIYMSPGLYWKESAFPRRIVIRNNVFESTDLRTWHYPCARAAILLGSSIPVEAMPEDITIADNAFRNLPGAAIWMKGAKNVTITGNKVSGSHQLPSMSKTVTPDHVFVFEDVVDLQFENNTAPDTGPHAKWFKQEKGQVSK